MTKSQAQKIIDGIFQSPADFIYLFASDSFISQLSGSYRRTVYNKNLLQRKYLNTLVVKAGYNYDETRDKIGTIFKDTYAMTPQAALTRLASGQDVAGKNWKAGIYGIGATYREGWTQNPSITVDATTGKLLQNGQEIAGQTGVYTGSGKTTGYTVTIDGVQYQSQQHNGKYYAGSYGTTEGAFNPDGTAYQAANAESIFQNIFTYLPMFQSLLEWFFSLMNITPIRTQNVVASQSDWVKTKNDADSWLWFIAGAGIIALLFRK